MNISMNTISYSNLNNNYSNNRAGKQKQNMSNPSFGAKVPTESKMFEPVTKAYDAVTTQIAKGLGSLLSTDFSQKAVKHLEPYRKNLVAHLACGTSVFLSGFYIKQTLQNKNLDKKKRTTLAINQGSVAILSAIAAYTVDKKVNKLVDKFSDKYILSNHDLIKSGTADSIKAFKKNIEGIRKAKTIMIFGFIYRFFSPVAVTPIANMIGDKIQPDPKVAKK